MAEQTGENSTLEKIMDGDLDVDSSGNLLVTQKWINKIKSTLSEDYDVVADGASIILINKNEMQCN